MAAPLPAKLKAADIQRFATRAAQLEKHRPIVTYWCEYYILQQILNKSLHTIDNDCQTYAVNLMDKLEAFKSANASNDAIVDDVAAKAYMENFALETFERAHAAQRSDEVTRQTADTFQAAATFLDTLGIWGQMEQEYAQKSKFAKFHALRIAKALKAGEDPNATNPRVEEPPASNVVDGEDELEAELDRMSGQQNGVMPSGVYRPPTVESAPGSGQPSRPVSTVPGRPMAPPPQTMDIPTEPSAPAGQHEPDVSPIEPMESATSRQGSVGGGYFPSVPTSTTSYDTAQTHGQSPGPNLAGEDDDVTMTGGSVDEDSHIAPQQPFSPADYYAHQQQQPAPTVPPPSSFDPTNPAHRPSRPPPEQATAQPPSQPPIQAPAPQPPFVPQVAPTALAAPVPPPAARYGGPPLGGYAGPPPGGYNTSDEATMAAQKHAKWAISALNFEDVGTAVKELRLALGSLGAG